MPFIGFLGPTWEWVVSTRILHRRHISYHNPRKYTRGNSYFCIFCIFTFFIQYTRTPCLVVGTPVLLRCPANVLGNSKPSSLADRCHSLRSLYPPPAALPSLPSGVRSLSLTSTSIRTPRERCPYAPLTTACNIRQIARILRPNKPQRPFLSAAVSYAVYFSAPFFPSRLASR